MSTVLNILPESAAGRQLRWYLATLMSGGDGASVASRKRYAPRFVQYSAATTDDEERAGWRSLSSRLGEIRHVRVVSESEFRIQCEILTAKERRWRFTLAVEETAPHRITEAQFQRVFDAKIEVREATQADGPVLADIERRCPIELGESSIYFDRGNDYFAFARLMEEVTVGIAFLDGAPAAVSCGALHPMRIAAVNHPVMTVVHLRVLPEHQRKGLWGAVNGALEKYRVRCDGSCAYVSANNAGMQHAALNTPNKWSVPVLRAQLSCADLAGPPVGREATQSDAQVLVSLLNRFHGQEEVFVPYTIESLTARLERAPKQYSWDKLWMTQRAAVGVWPAGKSLTVVTQSRDKRTESRRGIVLDYAFGEDGEAEFEALLRAWCNHLAAVGMDTLSIFTSPASPAFAQISALAHEVETFNMWTPGILEGQGAIKHGLYVDPIYF